MRRLRRSVQTTRTLVEAMEPRVLLSAVPRLFNSLKGGHAQASHARLASLISKIVEGAYTGTAYAPNGVNQTLSPETLATFYSTAARANMKVTIDWGDGTAPTAGSIVLLAGRAGAAKQFGITGMHQYATDGTFHLQIKLVVRSGAGYVTQSLHADATIQPNSSQLLVPIYRFDGATFQKIVGIDGDAWGNPSDPSNAFTLAPAIAGTNFVVSNIMIDWGDGTAPTPGVLVPNAVPAIIINGQPPEQTYSIAALHTYSAPGTYDVTITAEGPFQLTFGGPAPTPQTYTTHSTAVVSQNSWNGTTVIGTAGQNLSFEQSFPNLSPFSSARIDWGDGTFTDTSVSPGSFDPASREYANNTRADHVYTAPGTYRITTRFYMSDTPSDTAYHVTTFSTAAIAPAGPSIANPDIHGYSLSMIAGIQGVYWWFGGSNFSIQVTSGNFPLSEVMIDWGDGSAPTQGICHQSVAVTNSYPGTTYVSYQMEGHHTYAQAGTYDITVTGYNWTVDPAGHPDGKYVVHATANVAQNSPDGETITGTVGMPIDAAATFSVVHDLAAVMQASVDWGDGTVTPATVEQVGPPGARGVAPFSIPLQHTYAAAGTYRIIVHVWRTTDATLPSVYWEYDTAVIAAPLA